MHVCASFTPAALSVSARYLNSSNQQSNDKVEPHLVQLLSLQIYTKVPLMEDNYNKLWTKESEVGSSTFFEECTLNSLYLMEEFTGKFDPSM